MIILGIETTCDETGVGIVRDGREVLSNVTSSSISLHKKYKGVVPEVAAREQVKAIIPVITESLEESRVDFDAIDVLAVAYGPGLIGSLLVGVETAKTLAVVMKIPLIPVNHLIGHVYANWLNLEDSSEIIDHRNDKKSINYELQTPNFPLVALIVSGGHTDLILMKDHGKYRWLGGTRDDAAGEAFDKVARILGLGYPGGPEVEKLARSYKSQVISYKLPRPMIDSGDFDFSFSGLKTAVVNLVNRDQLPETSYTEIAYEFQSAIVDVLATKTMRAAKKFNVKSVVVGGGVAANLELRSEFLVHSKKNRIPVFLPSKNLSVDNGSMIAAAAFFSKKFINPTKLQANPGLYFSN